MSVKDSQESATSFNLLDLKSFTQDTKRQGYLTQTGKEAKVRAFNPHSASGGVIEEGF